MNKEIYCSNNIVRSMIRFAIPSVFTILVSELYNMVDTLFVGKNVGPDAIGALSVVFPIQRLIIAISMCLGIGVSNLISRNLGGKKFKEITKYIQSVVFLVLFSMCIITVFFLFFSKEICYFLGARTEILSHSVEYINIIIIGSAFLSFTTVFGFINISFGKINIMLLSISIGAIVNAILD